MESVNHPEIRNKETFQLVDISLLPEKVFVQLPLFEVQRQDLRQFCHELSITTLGFDPTRRMLTAVGLPRSWIMPATHDPAENDCLDGVIDPPAFAHSSIESHSEFRDAPIDSAGPDLSDKCQISIEKGIGINLKCAETAPKDVQTSLDTAVPHQSIILEGFDASAEGNDFDVDGFCSQLGASTSLQLFKVLDVETTADNSNELSTVPIQGLNFSPDVDSVRNPGAVAAVASTPKAPESKNQKSRAIGPKIKVLEKLKIDRGFFKCSTCNMSFVMRASWLTHLKSHQNETVYHCPFDGCSHVCERERDHRLHLKNRHDPETVKKLTCKTCNKPMANFTYLRAHAAKCSGGISSKPKASKAKKNKQPLKAAINTSGLDYPFPCPMTTCNKKFRTEGELQRHAKVHVKQKFKCPLCDKVYERQQSVVVHLSHSHGNENIQGNHDHNPLPDANTISRPTPPVSAEEVVGLPHLGLAL